MSLTLLPPATVRLLGSSQVITTVSSVIKELMENAFDAGATNIEIRLEKYGLEKIEVKDDGCGIVPEECLRVALPHYTSKISEFSDLEKVQSYGFRGEALYSLCAVAAVTLITRTSNDEIARAYVFDTSGKVVESKVSHGLKGTTVIATRLFNNLPVRKQVMSNGKRVNEELKKVERLVKSLAVVHPRVRVSLAHNKFLIWQKTSVSHLKQSVMQIIPQSITKQLDHILYNFDEIKLELLVPKRDCDITTVCIGSLNEAVHIFVNKRVVSDNKIEKFLTGVFDSYFGLPPNKFPICFVTILVPPDMLDVNLEPNKTRIFIRDIDNILDCLKEQLDAYYCKVDHVEEDAQALKCQRSNLKRNSKNAPVNPLASNNDLEATAANVDKQEDTSKQENYQQEIVNASINVNDENRRKLNGSAISLHGNGSASSLHGSNEIIGSDNYTKCNNVTEQQTTSFLVTNSNSCLTVESRSDQSTKEEISSGTLSTLSFDSHLSENKGDCDEISLSQWSRGRIVPEKSNIQDPPEDCLIIQDQSSHRNVEELDIRKEVREKSNAVQYVKDLLDSDEENFLLESLAAQSNCGDEEEVNNKQEETVVDGNELQGKRMKQTVIKTMFSDNRTREHKISFERQLDLSVSEQMGRKELSSFSKFGQEMRSKLLKESPGMSFTVVASTLAAKWKDLQEEERQKYEKVTKVKRKDEMPDNIVQPKKPKYENYSVEVNVNLDLVKQRFNRSLVNTKGIDIIGRIESSDLWLYSKRLKEDEKEIGVLSSLRLREACQYYENMENMVIPSKVLEYSLPITESDLGENLWHILIDMEQSFDEKFSMNFVSDKRITMNGFKVAINGGDNEQKVASLVGVSTTMNFHGVKDLFETLKNIESHGQNCTVGQSRCLDALKYIRSETIRQEAQSLTTPLVNCDAVTKYLNMWWRECSQLNCPHGQSVISPLYSISKQLSLL